MLTSVEIESFRCIEHAVLELDPRGTGIVGQNASGKTSLLEAIFFLAHGRSFRTATRHRLIQRGQDHFRVIARIARDERDLVASAEHGHGTTQMRLAGRGVSGVAEIAEVLPIQVIDPGVHRLIDEGSARRRRLVDWGVFHVKPGFLDHWRRYQRALSQRNTALREGLSAEVIGAWNEELLHAANFIDAARREYFVSFEREFVALATLLLDEPVALEYRRGWPEEVSLTDAFTECRARDLRLGTTTAGAHRADIIIRVDGVTARDRVSRGQQKLLASALILAQIQATNTNGSADRTCLLLDDPAAELDVDKLGKLLGAIARIPAQLVVSSVAEAGLQGIDIGRMFHVEQGRFTPVL